jgi:hypothetical protein
LSPTAIKETVKSASQLWVKASVTFTSEITPLPVTATVEFTVGAPLAEMVNGTFAET